MAAYDDDDDDAYDMSVEYENLPYHRNDVEAHPMQYSLSHIESNLAASTPLPPDICNTIAQYLLFDFTLKMDRTMIEYKSCKETTYYKIENMFAFHRQPIFCSKYGVTEFDVLIKLSIRNHPHQVQCIGDKYQYKDPDHKQDEQDESDEPDAQEEVNPDKYLPVPGPFMVCAFQVISPTFCTAPLTDALIWVFNERPYDEVLADKNKFNQRMDVNQLKYDINTNRKQRDEAKPVAFIKNPPRTELISYKLPFGILGKYVFIKCMANSEHSDNTDVQYIGVTIARL